MGLLFPPFLPILLLPLRLLAAGKKFLSQITTLQQVVDVSISVQMQSSSAQSYKIVKNGNTAQGKAFTF